MTCGKRKYKTEQKAYHAAIRLIVRRKAVYARTYWCKRCEAHHVTSQELRAQVIGEG